MKFYLISDTHFNHEKIKTYCQRPDNFHEMLIERWNQTVTDEDVVIHLGDVCIGRKNLIKKIMDMLKGRKWLVRGNHDRDKSIAWWCSNGFDMACDSMMFRNCLLTHEPCNSILQTIDETGGFDYKLPHGAELNLHGHLHNIWDGFYSERRIERDKELLGINFTKRLRFPWQRLFAVEYTDYRPVEFEKFVSHPDKYKARGPLVQ